MDTFLIVMITTILVALVVALIVYSRRKAKAAEALEVERIQESEIILPIELLPETIEIDENSIFEITDCTVIARISATIPAAAETAAKTIANKGLKNLEVYKAVIPNGATLAESKEIEGAVRGFYRGAKNIKGHANFARVDITKSTKAASLAKGAANIANVGALVVGQYYYGRNKFQVGNNDKEY
ncbi:MAG: hypothetical protein GXY49_10210 [Syntrophomonadaceae bacterium]|nr:hypothetical protein [Syntrophomonadaceae bacterium]